jgi:hypothetical protein
MTFNDHTPKHWGSEIAPMTGRQRLAIAVLGFCVATGVLCHASSSGVPRTPRTQQDRTTTGGAILHGVTVTFSNQTIIINVNVDGAVRVTAGRLTAPERIFIDLEDTRYLGGTLRLPVAGGSVLDVRVAQLQRQPAIARIVLDLSRHLPFEIVSFSKGLAIQVNIGPENSEAAAATMPQPAPPVPAPAAVPDTPVASPPVASPIQPATAPPRADPAPSPTVADTAVVPQVLVSELQSPISRLSTPEVASIPAAPLENTSVDEDGPTTPHQAAKANLPVSISAVTVSREGGDIDVHIEASGRLRPTARVFANPDRIVVDLANAYCDRERRIPVHRADVKDVGVSLYLLNPPVTRVVLTLARPHAYHLLGSGSSLTIRVDAQPATRTQAQPASPGYTGAPVTLLREPPTR